MKKMLIALWVMPLMLLMAGGGFYLHGLISEEKESDSVLETRVVIYQDNYAQSEISLARKIAEMQAAVLERRGMLNAKYVDTCNNYDRWVEINQKDKFFILTTTPEGHRQFEKARRELEAPLKIIR